MRKARITKKGGAYWEWPKDLIDSINPRPDIGERRHTFQSNSVLFNRVDGKVGNDSFSALQDGRHTDFLPLYWNLRFVGQIYLY